MVFRYPGGKNKLRGIIIPAFQQLYSTPQFEEYEFRDPFVGGGGLLSGLLDSTHVRKLWINDLDPGIAAIWTAIIEHHEEFKERVRAYTPHVEDFFAFQEELLSRANKLDTVDLALKKLAIHQMSYSGLGTRAGGPMGGKTQTDKLGRSKKHHVGSRWSCERLLAHIDRMHHLLTKYQVRHRACTAMNFRQIVPDSQPACLYLDPPYYQAGAKLYQYHFTHGDHVDLSNDLRKSSHPWLLSYDDCPEVHNLYDWAVIRYVPIYYSINSTRKTFELIITPKSFDAYFFGTKCKAGTISRNCRGK